MGNFVKTATTTTTTTKKCNQHNSMEDANFLKISLCYFDRNT